MAVMRGSKWEELHPVPPPPSLWYGSLFACFPSGAAHATEVMVWELAASSRIIPFSGMVMYVFKIAIYFQCPTEICLIVINLDKMPHANCDLQKTNPWKSIFASQCQSICQVKHYKAGKLSEKNYMNFKKVSLMLVWVETAFWEV